MRNRIRCLRGELQEAISKMVVQNGFQLMREIIWGQLAKKYAIKIVQLWEMQYFEPI